MAAPSPPTPNRPAGLNRSLLTVIGMVLLLGGAYAVLRGTGVAEQLLPGLDPGSALLTEDIAVPPWASYVAIAVGVVVGLLCLRWLLAQVQRRTTGQTWLLTTDGRGTTRMDTAAAAAAFTTEVESYAGVHSANTVVSGPRSRPALHLTLAVEDRAPVSDLRYRIDAVALPRLRAALELDTLPVEVLVHLGTSPTSRSIR